jgi:hypothetical protein
MTKQSIPSEDEFITQFSEALLKNTRIAKFRSYHEGWAAGWRAAIEKLLEAGIEPEFIANALEMPIEKIEEIRDDQRSIGNDRLR